MKPTPLYRSAIFALSCLLTVLTASPATAAEPSLQPGAVWADTQGKPIQAHGGGILFHEGVYYWYGENKDGPTAKDGACGARVEVVGVSAYKSKDLVNWVPLGLVLSAVPEDPAHDLHPTKILERPKVIYNPGTKKFVMWMHIDDKNYALARAGVATADQPAGPFTYLGSIKPDNTDSRDLTVFQDEDNSAWLIHSSDGNKTLRVTPLSADYLTIGGPSTPIFPGRSMEAPAIFKHAGKYYLIASGCTGWSPNEARSAVAPALTGPWTELGNPCVGPDAKATFRAQSSFVVPVQGKKGAFLFMADRWNPQNLSDSRYVWLPIEFRRDGGLRIEWQERWDLSFFDAPRPDAPQLKPASGLVETETVELTLAPQEEGTRLHYTLDGTTPTATSPTASGTLKVPAGREVQVVAINPQRRVSPVSAVTYYQRIPTPPQPEVDLTQVKGLTATTGYDRIHTNENIDGDPMRIAGEIYPVGLATHAHSIMPYVLNPGWRRFVAVVGIDDHVGKKGSIQCEIRIDGKLVSRSPILRGGEAQPWHFNVPIPVGARQISLITTDAGDGYGNDHANWVNVGFLK